MLIKDCERSILGKLGSERIQEEYEKAGLVWASSNIRSNGWRDAYSAHRETDKSPSAGVCLSHEDPAMLGYYRDHGDGTAWRFFEAMAQLGLYDSWLDARNAYALEVGINVDEAKSISSFDRIFGKDSPWGDLEDRETIVPITMLAKKKIGVTEDSIIKAGGRSGNYRKQNLCVYFPTYKLSTGKAQGYTVQSHTIAKFDLGETQTERINRRTHNCWVGEDGVKKIREAASGGRKLNTVIKVEGISDLLCAQVYANQNPGIAVITTPSGSTEDPKKYDEDIATIMRSCEQFWIIHDLDEAGKVGQDKWVKHCRQHGNVYTLDSHPMRGVEGYQGPTSLDSKEDFRDIYNAIRTHVYRKGPEFFPCGGLNLANDWGARMVCHKMAGEMEVRLGPEGDEVLRPNSEEWWAWLGIDVLGTEHGMVIATNSLGKTVRISPTQMVSSAHVIMNFGDRVRLVLTRGEEDLDQGPVKLATFADWMSNRAFKGGEINSKNCFYPGINRVDDGLLLVSRDYKAVFSDGVLSEVTGKTYKGMLIDPYGKSPDWLTPDAIHYIKSWTEEDSRQALNELTDHLSRWSWKWEHSPSVLACLLVATFIHDCFSWRPTVYITGSANTGKTYLLRKIRSIFGELCVPLSNPTEAGFRQKLSNTLLTPVVDELEVGLQASRLLETIRVCSRGDEVVKGSPNGSCMSFFLKCMPWLGSINVGGSSQADSSRMIQFELVPPAGSGDARSLASMPEEYWTRLGHRLMAGAVHMHKEIATAVEELTLHYAISRSDESHALPCAILEVIGGEGRESAVEGMSETREWNKSENINESDSDAVWQDLMLTVPYGSRYSIGQLLQYAKTQDAPDAWIRPVTELEKYGIQLLDGDVHVSCRSMSRILKDLPAWAGRTDGLNRVLKRADGARVSSASFNGQVHTTIAIPYRSH